MDKRVRWLLLLFLALSSAGCSRTIETPRINARDIAARALAEYDTNGDGVLDARELKRCPGLESCAKRLHPKSKDPRLSLEELEQVLTEYVDSQTGLMTVVCKVTLNEEPLAGAEVVLEPEAFMGDSSKPARGTTDEQGKAQMKIEGAPQPGCHLGIYRVRIAKADAGGRQMLPARYNTETQLGIEVGSAGLKGSSTFPFALKAR